MSSFKLVYILFSIIYNIFIFIKMNRKKKKLSYQLIYLLTNSLIDKIIKILKIKNF